MKPLVGLLCCVALALTALPSSAAPTALGPLLRVTTPGSTLCPAESEPEVAVTAAGTWVGYNDTGGCPLLDPVSFTTVQLLPKGGGAPRLVRLPALPGDDYYAGDPDLASDSKGDGIVLSVLRFVSDLGNNVGGLRVEVFRVAPDGRVTTLPSPSVSGSDDKEFVAVDRRDGTVYVVWDDVAVAKVLFRAFRGGRWSTPVAITERGNRADVAVGPKGEVAVGFESTDGVAVRVSRDGGSSFGSAVTVLRGSGPGRADPGCPLRPTIGNRQRAIKSPRVAYDRAGRLHVVAALGAAPAPLPGGVDGVPAEPGLLAGGQGAIRHASSADGRTFTAPRAIAPSEGVVQWNPALAATPAGGMAVSYLQTADSTLATYDARIVVMTSRGAAASPALLSSAAGELPPAQEANGNANCYGIGDYTGLAPSTTGVVAVWPTTVGSAGGGSRGDSDIAVRAVTIR